MTDSNTTDTAADLARTARQDIATAAAIHTALAAMTPASLGGAKYYLSDIAAHFGGRLDGALGRILTRLAANGLIALSRCDMPRAFDVDKVNASELDRGGATAHFLVKP